MGGQGWWLGGCELLTDGQRPPPRESVRAVYLYKYPVEGVAGVVTMTPVRVSNWPRHGAIVSVPPPYSVMLFLGPRSPISRISNHLSASSHGPLSNPIQPLPAVHENNILRYDTFDRVR
jgi:hypothetical protein